MLLEKVVLLMQVIPGGVGDAPHYCLPADKKKNEEVEKMAVEWAGCILLKTRHTDTSLAENCKIALGFQVLAP